MRVVVDARSINDQFPGIGRYVYNLLLALAQAGERHQFVVLYNPDLPNTRHPLTTLSRQVSIRLVATHIPQFSAAEQTQIPRMLRTMQADLFHAPYYVRPYTGIPCPSVTTLYDVIPRVFPEEVAPRTRLLFDLLTRQAIRASEHLLVLSASACHDFSTLYKLPRTQCTVTPAAADPRFRPQSPEAIAAVRARYHLPERYVLTVSSNKPHKNLLRLVEAWEKVDEGRRAKDKRRGTTAGERRTRDVEGPAESDLIGEALGASYLLTDSQSSRNLDWTTHNSEPLVPVTSTHLIIAGYWDDDYPQVRELIARRKLAGSVQLLPNVAEEDLPALYAGAEVFVFPSLYEGFGLPPLEAMACGVPVLCGTRSSLPEVVGDAALCVDVRDSHALADGLHTLLSDAALRTHLHNAALHRAAMFSWQRTAETTLDVYERVVWGWA